MYNSPKLRDYQERVKQEVYQHIRRGDNRVLIVAPTGSGKTTIAGSLVNDAVRAGKRVMFIVHRDKLISQTIETMERWGLSCGIIAGGYKENRAAPVQVCSFQTLSIATRELSWLQADLTIVDEAHITAFTAIAQEKFPKNAFRGKEVEGVYIGLTATPWRMKKQESLSQFFSAVVTAPMPKELIEAGHLVKPIYYHLDNQHKNVFADIDYIYDRWREIAQNSLTIAFCPSVKFAHALTEKFNEGGISAATVHGKQSRNARDDIFSAFEEEKVKVLCSCLALTEGFDVPKVRVGIFARNVFSRALYFQSVGRLVRPAEGKTDCIVLDQMNLFRRFGRFENLVIGPQDLEISDEISDGDRPTKQCANCHAEVAIQYRICPSCRDAFNIIGVERYAPEGQMIRVLEEGLERFQFSYYQRLIKIAYAKDYAPEWADQKYYEKYEFFPPKDWRRAAIGAGAAPEERERYEAYLRRQAAIANKSKNWIYEQLSLELGI